MQKKLIIIVLFFMSVDVWAQQAYFQSEEDSAANSAPVLSIKVIPSQLLWRFPAIALGLEHRLSKNWGIDYKVGLAQDKNNFSDDEIYFDSKSGFKSSVMFKNYNSENGAIGSTFDFFNGDSYNRSPIKSYIGFEVFFNQINFDRTRTFRFDCQNGCQYFQRATYGLKMRELGVRINVGFISEVYGPLGFEVVGGLGVLHQSLTEDNRKPLGFERMFGRLYNEEFRGVMPSFNIEAKLVYNLK